MADWYAWLLLTVAAAITVGIAVIGLQLVNPHQLECYSTLTLPLV